MLSDTIKKIREENPGALETKVGGCRFCGQTAALELPAEWDGAFVDEAVTEHCNCIEATIYTNKKKQKERAEKAVTRQFGENSGHQIEGETIDILLLAIDGIIEDRITGITVDIGDGLKAKINVTAKGAIKVERTKTEKNSQEA